MKRLRHNDKFHKSYYKQWPIFQEIRKQDKFLDLYREYYGEDCLVDESPPEKIEDDVEK